MVLFFVKAKQMQDDYERALVRLLNEETNQTIDESNILEAYKNLPAEIPADEEVEGDDDA